MQSPPNVPYRFVNINAKTHRTIAIAARTKAVVSFAIGLVFGVGCCWRGAVANGASRGGCADNMGSCGAVLELSNAFFGAFAGARFFFGFRPRLFGIRVTNGLAGSVIWASAYEAYLQGRCFARESLTRSPVTFG